MRYLPISMCEFRGTYRIHSRNFGIGIFDGVDGFIGIRTKWGERYLFTEIHWDANSQHGTVKPIEKMGELPRNIDIKDSKAVFEYLEKLKEE